MAKRVGRFEVSEKLIWEIMTGKGDTALFDGMCIVDLRRDFIRGVIEYYGTGPMFDEVPEGQLVPMYRPVWRDGETLPGWKLMD